MRRIQDEAASNCPANHPRVWWLTVRDHPGGSPDRPRRAPARCPVPGNRVSGLIRGAGKGLALAQLLPEPSSEVGRRVRVGRPDDPRSGHADQALLDRGGPADEEDGQRWQRATAASAWRRSKNEMPRACRTRAHARPRGASTPKDQVPSPQAEDQPPAPCASWTSPATTRRLRRAQAEGPARPAAPSPTRARRSRLAVAAEQLTRGWARTERRQAGSQPVKPVAALRGRPDVLRQPRHRLARAARARSRHAPPPAPPPRPFGAQPRGPSWRAARSVSVRTPTRPAVTLRRPRRRRRGGRSRPPSPPAGERPLGASASVARATAAASGRSEGPAGSSSTNTSHPGAARPRGVAPA